MKESGVVNQDTLENLGKAIRNLEREVHKSGKSASSEVVDLVLRGDGLANQLVGTGAKSDQTAITASK